MMKPTLLLRIAALISALFAAGHFAGGLQQWNPMGANPVFASMTSQHFPVDGGSRSYLDLYLGLGWSTQVFLVLQTVILWMMASLARSDPARVRPMIGAFAIALFFTRRRVSPSTTWLLGLALTKSSSLQSAGRCDVSWEDRLPPLRSPRHSPLSTS